MSSGKKGLSKQTFISCQQTSRCFPLLAEYMLKEEKVDYVLSGYFQDDPLEKRFGTYRQLSGANYFATVKQFLEAEKSIRMKSLITFSNYSMQEVQQILCVMCKNFTSEVNSTVHKGKKRNADVKNSSYHAKIKKYNLSNNVMMFINVY